MPRRASREPLTTWYLAEGATTGGFNLFYLLQNPTAQAATVQIQYLRPAPAAPITKTYTVGANTRRSIYVNGEDPGLDEAEISAVITSTNAVPIVVERAMYLNSNGQLFGAGHESAAVADLSTSWFFAEGATGPFFNMFILVANPGATDAALELRYLLPSGQVITRTHVARAHSRLTIGVHDEALELARTPVSTTLQSTNGVAVLAERAMWWPSVALVPQWQEGHNSAGAVRTGEKWGLADGEEGGAPDNQTYVLVANTSATPGSVQVTVIFEDGTTAQLPSPLSLARQQQDDAADAPVLPGGARPPVRHHRRERGREPGADRRRAGDVQRRGDQRLRRRLGRRHERGGDAATLNASTPGSVPRPSTWTSCCPAPTGRETAPGWSPPRRRRAAMITGMSSPISTIQPKSFMRVMSSLSGSRAPPVSMEHPGEGVCRVVDRSADASDRGIGGLGGVSGQAPGKDRRGDPRQVDGEDAPVPGEVACGEAAVAGLDAPSTEGQAESEAGARRGPAGRGPQAAALIGDSISTRSTVVTTLSRTVVPGRVNLKAFCNRLTITAASTCRSAWTMASPSPRRTEKWSPRRSASDSAADVSSSTRSPTSNVTRCCRLWRTRISAMEPFTSWRSPDRLRFRTRPASSREAPLPTFMTSHATIAVLTRLRISWTRKP